MATRSLLKEATSRGLDPLPKPFSAPEQRSLDHDERAGSSYLEVDIPDSQERGSRSINRTASSNANYQEQEQGIHVIKCPNEAEYAMDIVAIHGFLGAHRSRSPSTKPWTSSETGLCWIEDALPKAIPQARILSFVYNSNPENAADELLWELLRVRGPDRPKVPIIFMGHNLGGIVAKQLFLTSSPLRNSRKQVRELHDAIKGFAFFGTDHYGDLAENLLGIYSKITRYQLIPFPARVGLRAEKDSLLETRNQISRINHYFASFGGERLLTACFFEGRPEKEFGILVDREHSTLALPWVQNQLLDASHFYLVRFNKADDMNCQKVISALRNMVAEIQGQSPPISRIPQPKPMSDRLITAATVVTENTNSAATSGIRVLALDGGGVKGLFGVIVLQAIMEEVRKLDCPEEEDALRPCDYFDLIGGTSTGGLLAVMLGRLVSQALLYLHSPFRSWDAHLCKRMDLVSCKAAYKALSKHIFHKGAWRYPGRQHVDMLRGVPWYSSDRLESAVKEIVSDRVSFKERNSLHGKRISVTETPLKSSRRPHTKTFVCATIDSKAQGEQQTCCERLRTYDSATLGESMPCTIWEACRAMSAAPLYFPNVTINGRTYWDGGLKSNNPIIDVIDESLLEFPGTSFQAIVSIGTGKPPSADPGQNVFGFVNYLLQQMTNTEAKHHEFKTRHQDLLEDYFRFNEAHDLHKIDLASWQELDRVEELHSKRLCGFGPWDGADL